MNRRRSLVLAAAFAIVRPASLSAQTFPAKPIKLVVPFAPGGTTDVIARLLAHYMTERLGQQVVIDNRPGAGATMGSDLVAHAAPDGYTLVMSNIASHAIGPSLYKTIGYDPIRDFTHIALATTNPSVLVVHPSVPARTLADYLRLARDRDGALAYATSGAGSSNHLLGVRLGLLANVPLTHVPYRGAGPAMNDVISGHVPSMFDSLPSASQHIRAGTVRAIAVSGKTRSPTFPDLPTMIEQGVPGLISYSWFGVSGPKGMPTAIVERLHGAIMAGLATPEATERWAQLGAEASTMSPAEFTDFVRQEVEVWKPVVAASGASAD